MLGYPQACGFASSYFRLLSHHLMFHLKRKIYFHLHDTLVPTKWLVLHTNDIVVSTKMQTQLNIGKPISSKQEHT